MVKEYITADQTAIKWGLSKRRVQLLCAEGRVSGALKHATVWAIPMDANKPVDKRLKK